MNMICKPLLLVAVIAASGTTLTLPVHADAPAPARAQARFEVRFLQSMIDHHAMGVAMAELCTGRAIHPELEELCHSIIETQSAEIETLQGWLSDWYGLDHEPEMKRGHEKAMARLATLDGEDFEIVFLEMMIRHHAKAVRESGHCEHRAHHEELIELCDSIAASQTIEIAEMEEWLAAWY